MQRSRQLPAVLEVPERQHGNSSMVVRLKRIFENNPYSARSAFHRTVALQLIKAQKEHESTFKKGVVINIYV